MAGKRVHWVDALRIIVVLLIFAFHSARVFDSLGVFYAKGSPVSAGLTAFVGFLNVWQMPLLFLLAGLSTAYALGKRSAGQYIGERGLRILLPFLFGVLVIVPPQGWYAVRTNLLYEDSLVRFYRDYFALRWGNVSDMYGGPNLGHLWFIGFLFVFSAVALPLFLWMRGRGAGVATKLAKALARPWWWPVLAFVLLISAGLPDLGGHNPFTYIVWFVVGFVAASSDDLFEFARKARWWLLGSGLGVAVPVLITYDVRDRYPDPSWPIALNEFFFHVAGWLLCLAAIGLAMTYLDRPWRWTPYLAEASYPTYILHQTVIVAIGFYLVNIVRQPILGWVALTATSLVATYAIYELGVRRWAPTRFLFGMKPATSRAAT